jgi:putative DNA primase/helicase
MYSMLSLANQLPQANSNLRVAGDTTAANSKGQETPAANATSPRESKSQEEVLAEASKKIANQLRVFLDPGQVTELRMLKVSSPSYKRPHTVSGFYDYEHVLDMAKVALKRNGTIQRPGDAPNVYFIFNPLDPNLLARRNNRVDENAEQLASDADVLARRWLYIDIDPVRKVGMPATAKEKDKALEVAKAIIEHLRNLEWPEPVFADSGNGFHVFYRIDLPTDDGGLVKSILHALAQQFDTDLAKVDTNVFNPARIVKLYGTVARKGDSAKDRPHRRSQILEAPEVLRVVPRNLLDDLAVKAKKEVSPPLTPQPTSSQTGIRRDQIFERARRYIGKMSPAISGQGGHKQTFAVACRLVIDFGLSVDEALPLIEEWNATCQPPWEQRDLIHKLQDASQEPGPRGKFLTLADNAKASGVQPASNQETRSAPSASNEPAPTDDPAPKEAIDDPHRLARLFIYERCQVSGRLALRFHREEFHRWDGGYYRPVPEKELRGELTKSVKEEMDRANVIAQKEPPKKAGAPPPVAQKVTRTLISDVAHALASETLVPSLIEAPAWLDGDRPFPAEDILACRNRLVHLPSFVANKKDCFALPTPQFFSPNCLNFDFNVKAPNPVTWARFLNELWPDDPESINTLQEWMGYLLTPDTRQQKILMLIGPKRSGKGTIARVVRALVGERNVICPTLASLSTNFGLWPLLGKTVAMITDARISGRTDTAAVVERLLSISGEDAQTIDRKNLPHVTAKLASRFMLMTNELPKLRDSSAALPGRMILLRLTQSWYGREDTTLTDRLLAELPSILIWAIDGWKGLRDRGHFVQPETGENAIEELTNLSSPIGAFVHECCCIEEKLEVERSELFNAWKRWCEGQNCRYGDAATFGRNLRAVVPTIKDAQRRKPDDSRVRVYEGIGLGSNLFQSKSGH